MHLTRFSPLDLGNKPWMDCLPKIIDTCGRFEPWKPSSSFDSVWKKLQALGNMHSFSEEDYITVLHSALRGVAREDFIAMLSDDRSLEYIVNYLNFYDRNGIFLKAYSISNQSAHQVNENSRQNDYSGDKFVDSALLILRDSFQINLTAQEFIQKQISDPYFEKIYKCPSQFRSYLIQDSYLYRKVAGELKLVLPGAYLHQLIGTLHLRNGHMSKRKIRKTILNIYQCHTKSLNELIKLETKNCHICAQNIPAKLHSQVNIWGQTL